VCIVEESGFEVVVFGLVLLFMFVFSDFVDWIVWLCWVFGSFNYINVMELCGWGWFLVF